MSSPAGLSQEIDGLLGLASGFAEFDLMNCHSFLMFYVVT